MKINAFHDLDLRMNNKVLKEAFQGTLFSMQACVQSTAQEYYARGFSQGVLNGKAFHMCFGNPISPFVHEPVIAWMATILLLRGLMEDNGLVFFDSLLKDENN